MEFTSLLYEVEDSGIALITINREEKHNVLSPGVLNELDAAFKVARQNREVRGVILTGAGSRSFVAGADITVFQNLNALSGHRFALRGQAVFTRIEEMSKPVVAAVNGFALGGGCELALACHLRVASENAEFAQPEVNLGIIPGFGGTQRLPRLVGRGLATELILTGARINAQRAYEIGLVNRLVPLEQLLDSARELILTIASRAPIGVSMSLDAIRASDLPLPQALRYEASLFGQACGTDDFREGVDAFLNKRKAQFKGK